MKQLLTGAGLTNKKLIEAFKDVSNKPINELKVAFIITASLGEAGDKAWVVKDLNSLYVSGVAEVDIIDIAGSSKQEWLPRLERADVIWVEGGNTKFLMYHINKSGLQDELPKLLNNRLYVGVSAGSMVMGECLPHDAEAGMYPDDIFTEPYKNTRLYLGWVPVHILPHYRSPFFNPTDEAIEHLGDLTKQPIYAIDDASALLVEDGDIKQIISDGVWKVFMPRPSL